jgi:hypothetical protein
LEKLNIPGGSGEVKKSKMILSILALAIFMGESPVVYAAAPPTIEISGSAAMNPYGVYTSNGEVFLPIRWVAQELGAQSVEWDAKTKTINIKMDGTFDKYKKFMSYVSGLTPREAKREVELCPLSDQAKKIALPVLPIYAASVNENVKPGDPSIVISINHSEFMAYDTKELNGRIYISTVWIQELFKAGVHYNKVSNVISISSPTEKEIDQQLRIIEDALIPKTPKEALNLWGHGEQTRSGALQFAALSPEIRQKVLERVKEPAGRGWITGGSSPWVGPITLANEKKLSETMVEYTIRYPEVTSAGSTQDTEKMIIEKQSINGKEGWFITRLLFGNSYYSIISAEPQPPEEPIKFVPLQ